MTRHWHLFVRHSHPDWHGHCRVMVDTANLETQEATVYRDHSCQRTHWHFLFRHQHTESGR